MNRYERTSMGGQDGRFHTTAWTQMLNLNDQDSSASRGEWAGLVGRYWKPVYCYLRRKGLDNEAAKDLTQGFFSEVVLGRDLFGQADRSKGRFRTFLLTALDRYARDVHRAAVTRKRTPDGQLVHMDGLENADYLVPARDASPEEAFTREWAASLLDTVLAEVRQECQACGLAVHWQIFNARLVEPILGETAPPGLPELCKRFNVAGESLASNMMITVKRRFQAALRKHVRPLVENDEDVDAEIQELMKSLSAGAGS